MIRLFLLVLFFLTIPRDIVNHVLSFDKSLLDILSLDGEVFADALFFGDQELKILQVNA